MRRLNLLPPKAGTFRSATDLGVEVRWTFSFVGHGTALDPAAGTIALDVGGRLAPGLIDNHSEAVDICTAQLAVERPELSAGHILAPLWSEAARGVDVSGRTLHVWIVTHRSPDLDVVVSVAAVQAWIQHGRVPAWLTMLASFTSLVDQGRFHSDVRGTSDDGSQRLPIHETYLIAQASQRERRESDEELLQLGLSLLARFAEQPPDVSWHEIVGDASRSGASRLVAVPVLRAQPGDDALTAFLRDDDQARNQFEKDIAGAVTGPVRVPVRLSRGRLGTANVMAMALADEPRSKLFKYLARRKGFVLLAWPYRRSLGMLHDLEDRHTGGLLQRAEWFPRVAISTNQGLEVPITADGQQPEGTDAPQERGVPCLVGLGRRLEALERAADRAFGRRRGGAPRFEPDYCDNADPWYDGRGSGYTIVDGPRAGTLLAYSAILRQVGFGTLPDGVRDCTSEASPEEVFSETGALTPDLPYWEPTLARAFSVRVALNGPLARPKPGSDAFRPEELARGVADLWRRLWDSRGSAEPRSDQAEFSVLVGSDDHHVLRVSAVLASQPLPVSRWAAANPPVGERDPSQASVHEVAVGSEMGGECLFRTLTRTGSNVVALDVKRSLFHADRTFVLRAPATQSLGQPEWVLPLVRSSVTIAGLRAWRVWFHEALRDTKAKERPALGSALAGFWLWESRWIGEASGEPDGHTRQIATALREQGALPTLLEDTRRLAARLDAVVERLDAEAEARASKILSSTLFLLAAIGVMQFFQGLQSGPIVWERDWWWAIGVPSLFVAVLGWASGWWRSHHGRAHSPKEK